MGAAEAEVNRLELQELSCRSRAQQDLIASLVADPGALGHASNGDAVRHPRRDLSEDQLQRDVEEAKLRCMASPQHAELFHLLETEEGLRQEQPSARSSQWQHFFNNDVATVVEVLLLERERLLMRQKHLELEA